MVSCSHKELGGQLPPFFILSDAVCIMIRTLTRSRSADFHRATMVKLLAVAGVTFLLWNPLAPVRYVTADVLALAADQLRR